MEQLGDAIAAAWSSPLGRLAVLVALYWVLRLGLPRVLPRQTVYVRLEPAAAWLRYMHYKAGRPDGPFWPLADLWNAFTTGRRDVVFLAPEAGGALTPGELAELRRLTTDAGIKANRIRVWTGPDPTEAELRAGRWDGHHWAEPTTR
jgi:hypothetical protein